MPLMHPILPYPSKEPATAAYPKPEFLTKSDGIIFDPRFDKPPFKEMGNWNSKIRIPVVGREPLNERLYYDVKIMPGMNFWGIKASPYIFTGGKEHVPLAFNKLNTHDLKIPERLLLKTPLVPRQVHG
jgi:hypothetical protein